jgi:predicted metal-dependent RNase
MTHTLSLRKLMRAPMVYLNDKKMLAGDPRIDGLHKKANDRKREVYWIGFLEGALSSNRIENGEEEAILAEAEKFVAFFNDPDAAGQSRLASCFCQPIENAA